MLRDDWFVVDALSRYSWYVESVWDRVGVLSDDWVWIYGFEGLEDMFVVSLPCGSRVNGWSSLSAMLNLLPMVLLELESVMGKHGCGCFTGESSMVIGELDRGMTLLLCPIWVFFLGSLLVGRVFVGV